MGNWAEECEAKILAKMPAVAERSRGIIPYSAQNGRFDDMSKDRIGWWTNGFWGGLMWQLYAADPREVYRENAIRTEKEMDRCFLDYRSMDHDSGFRWLPTSLAHLRVEDSPESYNRLRLAADNLAGRFNPIGNYIRAWNDWDESKNGGWAIIDCMMNLPLLYWAGKTIEDPRYTEIALRHARTAAQHFVREDGSVCHIVEFNPATGAFVKSLGGQGLGVGSSWTRGQAWGLYGFTLSYRHTKKEEFLDTARKIADAFLRRIPASGLIPVDFDQPLDCGWEDSTAAAIAACGFLELSKYVNNNTYQEAGERLLRTLAEKRCNFDPETDELLEKCTAAYHDEKHEFPIIYGDYFFVEGILRLTGKGIFIWG